MRKFILSLIATTFLFLSVAQINNNIYSFNVYADETDEEEQERNKKKEDLIKSFQDEGYSESLEKSLDTAIDVKIKQKDYSVGWYATYLLFPGNYLEDVDKLTWVGDESDQDRTLVHTIYDKKTVCYHNEEPQNLLNHNCNIPAPGTELIQNISFAMSKQGMQNAQLTSSQSFLGVPIGIPNGEVPINPNLRKEKYTALELYGYNLEYTSYIGEWDYIQVSTAERLLANIGFWGKAKLAGASVFNGVGNMLNQFWNGWTYSPTKWAKKSNGFVDGVASTVFDTSDAVVVASRAWKRPGFTNTLYNTYYLSDRQVIERGQQAFLDFFIEELFKRAEQHPRIKKVLSLMIDSEDWKHFEVDNNKYTEESIDALNDWNKCTADPKNDCGREPELVVMPEKEQFAEWKREPEQIAYSKMAKDMGIICYDIVVSYKELRECWVEPWTNLAKKELSHDSYVMQTIMDSISKDFVDGHPEYDPNISYSHYVCADEEGNPIGENLADYQLLYTRENTRNEEFINAGCKNVRPSIKGALFGNGENDYSDTRYKIYREIKSNKIYSGLDLFGSVGKGVSKFSTIITNTLLSLAYSDIIGMLKLDKIVLTIGETFRDSIFFPMSVLAIAITGFYIMFGYLTGRRQGAIQEVLKLLVVYCLSVLLLFNITNIMKIAEYVPNQIDNFLAETIIIENNNNNLCTTTGEYSVVRSIQCSLWERNIFTPWILGQWGVHYDKLNDSNFNNKNKDLVGTGKVHLGNGVYEENWALYQLEKTKTGTITTRDPSKREGTTLKSIYKIVDLQAGPNNGALSDGKYLKVWSGIDSNNRNFNQFLSGIVSFVSLLVIGGLAIIKIELKFVMLLNILFLVFILLRSLLPNGTSKLIETASGIVGLLVKRTMVSLLIIIVSSSLLTIGANTTHYPTIALFYSILLTVFFKYYKEFVKLLAPNNNALLESTGEFFGRLKPTNILPKSINLWYQQSKARVSQGLAGMIGGYFAGKKQEKLNKKAGLEYLKGNEVLEGMKKGFDLAAKRGMKLEFNRQRRKGLGFLSQYSQAVSASKQTIIDTFNSDNSTTRNSANILLSNINNRIITKSYQLREINNSESKDDKTLNAIKNDLKVLYKARDRLGYTTGIETIDNINVLKLEGNWNLQDEDVNKAILNATKQKVVRDPQTGKVREMTINEKTDRLVETLANLKVDPEDNNDIKKGIEKTAQQIKYKTKEILSKTGDKIFNSENKSKQPTILTNEEKDLINHFQDMRGDLTKENIENTYEKMGITDNELKKQLTEYSQEVIHYVYDDTENDKTSIYSDNDYDYTGNINDKFKYRDSKQRFKDTKEYLNRHKEGKDEKED